jgi:trehalose 6-phosphate phosphatase
VHDDPLAAFRGDPAGSAVLLDVDGTLAPIVARPELARVPAATLAEVERLVASYGLVAVVSGRPLAEVRLLVPVTGLLAAGNHGFELDLGDGPRPAPAAAPYAALAVDLAARLRPTVAQLGAWIEEKGPTLTVHFRQAADPAAVESALLALAGPPAAALGFEVRAARRSIELRPRLPVDKGTATRALLAARPCRRSLYCGDDATDVDAFAVVDVAVAVASDEAPAGVAASADLVVGDVAELLRAL